MGEVNSNTKPNRMRGRKRSFKCLIITVVVVVVAEIVLVATQANQPLFEWCVVIELQAYCGG